MAQDASETTADDLPPHTWRQWWRELPLSARICSVSGLFFVLLCFALILRIVFALWESRPIRVLRSHGNFVHFPWEGNGPGPFQELKIIEDVRHGRWCINLDSVHLKKATDTNLASCARDFPNLKRLFIEDENISQAGLQSILQCRNLYQLDVHGPAINDDFVKQLLQLPDLKYLGLSETVITDTSLVTLRQMPKLQGVDLQCTYVSQSACQSWHAREKNYSGEPGHPGLDSDYHPYWLNERGPAFVIQWRDNQLTNPMFERRLIVDPLKGQFYIRITGLVSDQPEQLELVLNNRDGYCFNFWWEPLPLKNKSDGDYHLTLKVGDFESEPVTVHVEKGKSTSPDRIEFKMPCTKAEALRSLSERRASAP
ncbi:MAG: hypothetical protein U0872_03575 [Planctomycetaceae bacterium]